MSDHPDEGERTDHADRGSPPTLDELVRAATRVALGSAGLAVASAKRWQGGSAGGASASEAATTLASAAMGLGLRAERVVVRGTAAAGSTAAALTWGVVHATPLRGPVERLAEQFRAERRLSEQEVSDAVAAIVEALSELVIARVDLDRVVDRIALERVLTRMDRREIARRIDPASGEGATA
jgi:hypothetical protein